jgi:deoxyribonuclease-4
MVKIGSNVRNNGDKMLIGSIEEALKSHENCFMIYLGAPQNTFRKPIILQHAEEMAKIAKENNISLEDVIVHAPYLVNLAQTDEHKHQFAVDFLSQELMGVESIGARIMVVHPGAHMGQGPSIGISQIAQGINEIFNKTKGASTMIAIETMAGKGTECGKSFEEIAQIIRMVDDKSRIGVCLDTCHIHDAGYDIVNHYEEVIQEFDQIIGLNYLKVIHLNDSKNVCGSHKDRHENIGFGQIGFETLEKFVNDPRFASLCHILETPFIDDEEQNCSYSPYPEEIDMIRKGTFNENLKKEIIDDNRSNNIML